jgi:hypothetical protein
MVPDLAYVATSLTAPSMAVMSVARPAPTPRLLVGVLTLMRIISASAMVCVQAVEKKRFGKRAGC